METGTSSSSGFSRVALGRLRPLFSPPDLSNDYVPQANDLGKVFELVWSFDGPTQSPSEVATRFEFDPRQAFYYIEAARELGLVQSVERTRLALTQAGLSIRGSDESGALRLFIERVVANPVVRGALDAVLSSPDDHVPKAAISKLVEEASRGRYQRSTIGRRTESLISWMKWLENNSEFVK